MTDRPPTPPADPPRGPLGEEPRVLVEACELAVRGPDPERWRRITVLAAILSPRSVDILDEALRDWPDAIRTAPHSWGVPIPPVADPPYCPPALRIARRLEIVHRPLTPDDLQRLLACEHLQRLRALTLFDNALDPRSIAVLSGAQLPALRELSIGGHDIDDAGVRVLANARTLSAIVTLGLPANGLSDTSLQWLASSTALAGLSVLDVPENRIGDDGLAALARSRLAAQLRSLDLAGNDIGPAGLTALFQSAELPRLEHLRLALNHAGDDGVAALASSRARFTSVNLSENRITAAGVRTLTSGPAFAGLCRLSLAYNPLGPEGALALATTPRLPALRALDLSGTGIGIAGALAILESAHLPLRALELRDLGIDDDGARRLLSSGALSRLDSLDLGR